MSSDRLAELSAFLDQAFDGEPGIADEFPSLVSANVPERRLVIRTHAGIAAHAAWRPLVLRSGGERLRAAGIGLVTTHPAWRGQGLATRVVAACLEAAARAGCQLALLFAGERSLYTRLGFEPVGRERRTAAFARAAVAPGALRELAPPDPVSLLALLETQPFRVEREAREQARLLAIPRARVFAWEHGERVRSYCVVGKGRDLGGVVHEWAGEPAAVASLLGAVAARLGPVRVLSPGWSAPPIDGAHELVALAQGLALQPGASARELLGDATTPARFPTYVWGLDSF